MGKDQDDADDYERSEHGLTLCHEACGKAHSMPGLLIDNAKSRMLEWRRISQVVRGDLKAEAGKAEGQGFNF